MGDIGGESTGKIGDKRGNGLISFGVSHWPPQREIVEIVDAVQAVIHHLSVTDKGVGGVVVEEVAVEDEVEG